MGCDCISPGVAQHMLCFVGRLMEGFDCVATVLERAGNLLPAELPDALLVAFVHEHLPDHMHVQLHQHIASRGEWPQRCEWVLHLQHILSCTWQKWSVSN